MKRLLQLGFVLGLAGTLAAAWFAPVFQYTRYRSETSVVANVGRIEQFQVHLPVDRIDSSLGSGGSVDSGLRLQHFKLRDAEGNVIGLAARHEVLLGDSAETAWLLSIPSRGTIALASSAPRSASIESQVAARGIAAGQSTEKALSIDAGQPARSIATTGEFSGIDFELVETWVVSGVDEDGSIRGTLQLNTVARQST
jgi:hypothetical protein